MNFSKLMLAFALVLFFATVNRSGWDAATPFLAAILVLATNPEVRHG